MNGGCKPGEERVNKPSEISGVRVNINPGHQCSASHKELKDCPSPTPISYTLALTQFLTYLDY